jgi:hypothetical protein
MNRTKILGGLTFFIGLFAIMQGNKVGNETLISAGGVAFFIGAFVWWCGLVGDSPIGNPKFAIFG